MRKLLLIAVTPLLLALASSARADTGSEIENLLKQFLELWNKHDPHEWAQIFAEDADVTNFRGTNVHGRTAIEAFMRPSFTGPTFKDSTYYGKVRSVRIVKPDVAIVDIDWEMTGARARDGSPWPKRKGLLDWVVVRQNGRWEIVAYHNTEFTADPPPAK